MLSYLTAEANFLRAFGNRCLLLIFMCVFVRSGVAPASPAAGSGQKASVFGLSLDINPALIVAFGPVVALLILISLKLEADTLRLARKTVLEEAVALSMPVRVSRWVYALFAVPSLACAYMTVQFTFKLFPGNDCAKWSPLRQLYDFGGWEKPSIYCLGDLTTGTPYLYVPLQTWIYVACVSISVYLTRGMVLDWVKARGGGPLPTNGTVA